MGKRVVYWVNKAKYKEQKSKYSEYLNRERNQKFYHSKEWQQLRLYVLGSYPFCQVCDKEPATEVHHVININSVEGWSLRLSVDHLKSICRSCHQTETRKEQEERRQQEVRKKIDDRMKDLNNFD